MTSNIAKKSRKIVPEVKINTIISLSFVPNYLNFFFKNNNALASNTLYICV